MKNNIVFVILSLRHNKFFIIAKWTCNINAKFITITNSSSYKEMYNV